MLTVYQELFLLLSVEFQCSVHMVSGVAIFQVEKLRLREVKQPAPNHTAKKWWGWDLNLGKQSSQLAGFISRLCYLSECIHTPT